MTKLILDDEGPGSHAQIVDYIRRVIDERTTVNDDTTAERLARGITTSVLSRLGFGYSEATGSRHVRDEGDIEDL